MTVPPAAGGRALLVDDDPGVLRVVRGMLSAMGLDVDAAGSGGEGVTLLARDAYDLIVTDLVMPDVDGWHVVEAARRLAPGIPVILATASASPADRDRARGLGLELLAKPFTLASLRSAVERVGRVGTRAPGGPGAAPTSRPAAEGSPRLVDEMRAILEAVRSTVDHLAGVVAHTEAQAEECRETTRLLADEQRQHAITVEALLALQARYERLDAERRETLSLLEEVARRLRP